MRMKSHLALLLLVALAGSPRPVAAQEGFSLRGVIFGPYGRIWSHADRMEMIRWMPRNDVQMNIYVHAPKNDVYQRLQWREAYPPEVLGEFLEEVGLGASLGVAWVPNLSPGVPLVPSFRLPTAEPSPDVCFSCEEDLDLIVDKFRPFFEAGARAFMISFDDVQKVSTHPRDYAAYGLDPEGPRSPDEAYGWMNADLLNRARARLDALSPGVAGDVTLLTVPADYAGTAQTPYLKGFSEAIDCRVRVMWTGTAIVSHEISKTDAAYYRDAVWPPEGRCDRAQDGQPRPKLLVWDNFPVNDYNGNAFSGAAAFEGFRAGEAPREVAITPEDVGFAGTELPTNFKLNVGPYKGRGADLVEQSDGILANPMNEAEASKIPLYTVAAYLADPSRYADDLVVCLEDPDYVPDDASTPQDEEKKVDRASCEAEKAWLAGIASLAGAAAKPLLTFVNQMRSTPLDRTESPVFVRLRDDFLTAFETAFWTGPWQALADELGAEERAPDALRAHLGNDRFLQETQRHLAQLEQNARAGRVAAKLLAAERPSLAIRRVEPRSDGKLVISGSAAPPDLTLAARLLAELLPLEPQMRASPYSVHGDRLQQDFGNFYVLENEMDEFTGAVHRRTLEWLPLAARAASGPLRVMVDGAEVPVSADGSFQALIDGGPRVIDVIVTDAAGGASGLRLALP